MTEHVVRLGYEEPGLMIYVRLEADPEIYMCGGSSREDLERVFASLSDERRELLCLFIAAGTWKLQDPETGQFLKRDGALLGEVPPGSGEDGPPAVEADA